MRPDTPPASAAAASSVPGVPGAPESAAARLPDRFEPLAEAAQPAQRLAGYKETFLRTPLRAPHTRPATLTEITGPLQLARKLANGACDLSRLAPGAPQALGQLIWVTGRVLDEDGAPVRASVIEVWQANSAGRYIHKMDAGSPFPLDPNFTGSGRCLTDHEGRYAFLSVKPGAYPVPNHPTRWWRPPHIHLSLFGPGFMSRLVTQMFFPDDPLNAQDLILHSVPDPRGRERLVSRSLPMMELPRADVLGYRHDIVLRGHRATPMGL